MDQKYHNYTAVEHETWRLLFERQLSLLRSTASKAYLEGICKVGFTAEHIPDFNRETNPKLRTLTGWEVYAVPGLIPHREFYTHLAEKRFPASTWLRTREQLDYLEEPDMFHDTFGHVPLLANGAFCDFMAELSRLALVYIDDETMLEVFSRVYWYTVEFGLIRENGALKIYGGGILSSFGESVYCLEAHGAHFDFDIARIVQTPYVIDHYQDRYFILNSYEQLYGSVAEMAGVLARRMKEIPP